MHMVVKAKGGVRNKEAVQRRHLLAADPEIGQRHHMRPGLQESDLHSTTLQVPLWAQNTANTDCEHSTHHCTSCEGQLTVTPEVHSSRMANLGRW